MALSHRRRLWLVLVVISVLAQLVGLYRPGAPPAPEAVPHLDKVGHVIIFAMPVLVMIIARLVWVRAPVSGRFQALVVLGSAGHAVLSELIQARLLVNRSGDLFDVVADLIGVLIGVALARLIMARMIKVEELDRTARALR